MIVIRAALKYGIRFDSLNLTQMRSLLLTSDYHCFLQMSLVRQLTSSSEQQAALQIAFYNVLAFALVSFLLRTIFDQQYLHLQLIFVLALPNI